MVNEIIEGDEWATYGMLGRLIVTKHGITYGREPIGDRALVVLVGVTPHQGVWENHMQGEAAQVEVFSKERARDVRNLNWRNSTTGEPDDTESGPVRFGKGRREKAR